MSDVIVRPARPFDSGPMVRLLNAIVRQNGPERTRPPMTAPELDEWMSSCDLWHLAERAGEVVGFQWVEGHPDLPPRTCEIATFVGAGRQAIGIGTQLFDATRKAAKASGFTHIHARIRATNEGGLIYYQSRGFERLTPRGDPPVGAPPVQGVTMTYRL